MALFVSPHHAWAFGIKDVMEMSQDGVSDDLILEKIDHSGKTFHLDADDIHDLKEAGVSDTVISAMLRTEDAHPDDSYYDNGAYYPYPYPYPYAYPRVIVGLNLGRSYGYYRGRPYYNRGFVGHRDGRGYGGRAPSGGFGGGGHGGSYGGRAPGAVRSGGTSGNGGGGGHAGGEHHGR